MRLEGMNQCCKRYDLYNCSILKASYPLVEIRFEDGLDELKNVKSKFVFVQI